MKRRLEVSPQARRDLASILLWYRENLGARAALKVARTVQSRLQALEAGRVRWVELPTHDSKYFRVIARKHVLIFRERGDELPIVRIVHGARDLEAIAANLESGEGTQVERCATWRPKGTNV